MPSEDVDGPEGFANLAPSTHQSQATVADSPGRPPIDPPSGAAADRGEPARAVPGRDEARPTLRRVTLDGKPRKRIHPGVVGSAMQIVDLAIVLVSGFASLAQQPGHHWPLSSVQAATALLVMALMTRSLTPDPQRQDMTRQSLARLVGDGVAHALVAFGFALIAVIAVFQPDPAERTPLVAWLLMWASVSVAGIALARLPLSMLQARWRRAGRLKQLVAIYGTGDLAERLVERLGIACPETIEIVGVFDDRAGRGVIGNVLQQLPHGTTDELVEMSRQLEIDRLIVALPHSAEKRLLEILRKLHKMPVEISLAPDLVGFHVPSKHHPEFGGLPLLDVYSKPLTFGQTLVKGAFDRLAAGLGIVMLSPLLLAVAAAIKLDSRGPVLFRQNRYGFGDRVIGVYKFRTMKAETSDANGEKQTEVNDPRITRVGGLLRRLSIDELPQLLNVLRGELSLVGPRPHAVSMRVRQRRNEDIVPDYALRHHVKPGITGWAQVNGYHGPVDTERHLHQRVAYDLDYINHWSLWFDIRIIVRTAFVAFGHRQAF